MSTGGRTNTAVNGRAAELAGNQTLADQIFNATVPSVVSAGGNNNAAAANNNGSPRSSLPESPQTPQSAGKAMKKMPLVAAAGDSTSGCHDSAVADHCKILNSGNQHDEDSQSRKVFDHQDQDFNSEDDKSEHQNDGPKDDHSPVGREVDRRFGLSKRSNTLQSLRSSAAAPANKSAASNTAPADTLQLLALDELMSREKKWR